MSETLIEFVERMKGEPLLPHQREIANALANENIKALQISMMRPKRMSIYDKIIQETYLKCGDKMKTAVETGQAIQFIYDDALRCDLVDIKI